MPKVQELARELGMTSQELLRYLDRIGRPAAGHTSIVDDDVARRLRSEVGNGAAWRGNHDESAVTTLEAQDRRESHAEQGPGWQVPDRAMNTSAQSWMLHPYECPCLKCTTYRNLHGNGDPETPPVATEPSDETLTTAPAEPDVVRDREREEAPGKKAPEREAPRRGWSHSLAELPVLIFFAFIIAVVIKTFLAQAFFIPSESMLPTLGIGDRVLVEKLSYRFGSPDQGDVIVFAKDVFSDVPEAPWHEDVRNFLRELLGLPTGQEEDYIKRVVAVGGDRIRYSGNPRQLQVNGAIVEEPYLRGGQDGGSQSLGRKDCERLEMTVSVDACEVPAGSVFVMGDNRGNSSDSRSFGPVPEDKIIGRAFIVIWPPSHLGGL